MLQKTQEWEQGVRQAGCLLGITLYWQCDNARRAAAVLLKGLHRERGMAALGGNGGSKGGRVCTHLQWSFLFVFPLKVGMLRQTSKLVEEEDVSPSLRGTRWWKTESKRKKKRCKGDNIAVKYKDKLRPSKDYLQYRTKWIPSGLQRSLGSGLQTIKLQAHVQGWSFIDLVPLFV